MKVLTHTEAGGKPANEDYLLARPHPLDPAACLCFLADGQGGRAHGARAAQTAVETAFALASAEAVERLRRLALWETLLRAADRAAAASGGFTTLVGLLLAPGIVVGASVGDSKAWASPSSGPAPCELTHSQPKNPPVGSGAARFAGFQIGPPAPRRVLLASDGVWKFCGPEALEASFRLPAEAVVQHLQAAIRSRGGPHLPDDFSLILVELEA